MTATLTSILFTTDPSALGVCPGAACNGSVNTGTTLTFLGGPLGTKEGILINNGVAFGTPPPAGATIVFDSFLQFAAHPNLKFNLVSVDPGSTNTDCAGLAIGFSCSLLVNGTPSPVVLTLIGSDLTLVSISLHGIAVDGSGTSSSWTGGFSATIPGTVPFDLATFFCGADAICSPTEVQNSPTLEVPSVSGSFTASSVPEPSTTVLMGAGLILLSFTLRRVKVM
ncbi:MAG: PEP-CTERM sorting domain-containing protein [Candidatus Solibacter sp.]